MITNTYNSSMFPIAVQNWHYNGNRISGFHLNWVEGDVYKRTDALFFNEHEALKGIEQTLKENLILNWHHRDDDDDDGVNNIYWISLVAKDYTWEHEMEISVEQFDRLRHSVRAFSRSR